jgi:hypothetical protein
VKRTEEERGLTTRLSHYSAIYRAVKLCHVSKHYAVLVLTASRSMAWYIMTMTDDILLQVTCIILTLATDRLYIKLRKAVPLHAMEALGGRGGIAPTHS